MNRSQRRHETDRVIARQVAIAHTRPVWFSQIAQPHRFAKRHWANCGQANCSLCCNPRKRGEVTMQEKRFVDDYEGF